MSSSLKRHEGSYGIVYGPPAFQCIDPDMNYKKNVSKLFKKRTNPDDIIKKYKSFNFDRIDPNEDYFIWKIHKCELNEDDIKKAGISLKSKTKTKSKSKSKNVNYDDNPFMYESSKSKSKSKPNEKQIALNFSYGGLSLFKLLSGKRPIEKNIDNLKKYLIGLTNILQGIKILQENNIYHCDIKPNNIVFDEPTQKFKLIDFDSSIIHINNISDDNLSNYHSNQLTPLYSPPEFNFLKFHQKEINTIFRILGIKELSFSDTHGEEYREEIRNKTISQEHLNKLNMMYKSFDIWSFGMTLYYIYKYFESVLVLKHDINQKIKSIIKQFLVADYKTRLDIDNALSIYSGFISSLEEPLTSTTRGGNIFKKLNTRKRTRSNTRKRTSSNSRKRTSSNTRKRASNNTRKKYNKL